MARHVEHAPELHVPGIQLTPLVYEHGNAAIHRLDPLRGVPVPEGGAGARVGIEQLQVARAQGEPAEMEEERRLCYVGMTRAKEALYLTMARRRRLFGQYDNTFPSRFFMELSLENVQLHEETAFPIPGLADEEPSTPLPEQGKVTISDFTFVPEPIYGEDSLRPGMQVKHPMFGVGQVMHVEGIGGDARVTVYFPRGGKKKLIAKYANLEIV